MHISQAANFMTAANYTVLCVDITPAIQQKVDNVTPLPKATEPYPSVHNTPLNRLLV